MTYVSYLSLPTNPLRADVFARGRGAAPEFDERLGVWIVLDPETITDLLQDTRLLMPDIGAALTALEQRYDLNLPNVRWAGSVLPLLVNGEQHRKVRAPLAKLLSSEKRREGAWRGQVSALFGEALSRTGRFDAFNELLLPVINAIFRDITGVAVDFPPLTLTKIFDRYASYRHLVGLEDHIKLLRAILASAGTPAEAEATVASLVVLGRDSLLSSLAESFVHYMDEHRGLRLDAQGPPARLYSGVAIGERIAREDMDVAGVRFAAGDRIRMYFQSFHAMENETDRYAFFGAGVHSCLGRALALDVWTLMVAELAKPPRTVVSVESEYDRGVVFTMPKFINLELA
jgi:cytochrome P450